MKKHPDKKCGVCEIPDFERNNYYYEKLMTERDFRQEQSYNNEKRWLINRMILGWGVVCGLDVYWLEKERKLRVHHGLAIDCCGREVLIREPVDVRLDELEKRCRHDPKREGPQKLAVCLEYYECKSEPVHLPPEACEGKERTEYNRIRDSYKIRVVPLEDACLPDPPGKFCHLDHIQCGDPPSGEGPELCATESLHDFLCRRLKEGCPECRPCDCLVLAIVTIEFEREDTPEQQEPYEERECEEKPDPRHYPHCHPRVEVDCCTGRRLVYNNPLLFDLIHCHHGDLPHIVDFSWRRFLPAEPSPKIDWDTFVEMVDEGLTVTYDQPLHPDTLNPCSFLVRVRIVESGTGHAVAKYLPGSVHYREDPCPEAVFMFDGDWKSDELHAKNSELRSGVEVEVVQRGSMIVGRNGKGLDGEYVGLKLPTGNGSRCGDFLLCFRVEPRWAKKDKDEAETYDV